MANCLFLGSCNKQIMYFVELLGRTLSSNLYFMPTFTHAAEMCTVIKKALYFYFNTDGSPINRIQ